MKHPKQISDGFFFLFRGGGAVVKTKGAGWLLIVPILVNLGLFGLFVLGFWAWGVPTLTGLTLFAQGAWWVGVLVWTGIVAVFLLMLIGYAFIFSMIAEVVGAPFYEEIGARIDKAANAAIVERSIWQEVWLAATQESVKLGLLLLVVLFGFLLQFLPGIGQLVSAVFGFSVLVVTAGADAVGPALARRGLMLGDRRRWVLKHLLPVLGLGAAKALGLVVPIFNIIVLPMAAAGGTLLVQKYDSK